MGPTVKSDDWLAGLAGMGCTFMLLPKDTKQTGRAWETYTECTGKHGLALARQWLKRGYGVGILLPAEVWVLDSDSPAMSAWIEETLLEAQIIPLAVKTQGKGKHFYFRFPADFPMEGLKNHVCHPRDADGVKLKADWKLGTRTMVVGPGTIYKGRPYLPLGAWREPPRVDPRMFLPDGQFWRVPDDRPFLTNPRPLADRLFAARQYLRVLAPLPVKGKGSHLALARVCSHIVAYHLIPTRTALTMLAPWSARRTDKAGRPCPWSRTELISALDAAVGSTPEAGVKAYQRAEAARSKRERIAAHVCIIKTALTTNEAPRVPVCRVRRLLRWFGLDLTETALGDALRLAGVNRIRATQRRIWTLAGLRYQVLVNGLLTAKSTDSNKQGLVLPGICPLLRQVEQVVSVGSAA